MSRTNRIDAERCRISLEALHKSGRVSVLPDYFVDRFLRFESLEELIAQIKFKSKESGGGSIRGTRQAENKGGNAVNIAYSLATFGSNVHLVAIAKSLAADTLSTTFDRFPNVTLDIVKGAPGYTVALEFKENDRLVNVMISDTGDLANFDGSSIPEKSWNRIATSKICAVLNWSAVEKGTELCEKVFSFAHSHGALTFLDPADVSERASDLPMLKKQVFDKGLLDYLSINDNEARIICSRLASFRLPLDYSLDDLKNATVKISDQTNCYVDLHTRKASVSCRSGDCIVVPCHKVEQRTVTGAGDIWDAASIMGRLLGWEPTLRLSFANAAAGLYVSKESGEPPTASDVLEFIENHKEFHDH